MTEALRQTVLLVAVLNLAYFGVEFVVALAIGSVSLFADSRTRPSRGSETRARVGKLQAGGLAELDQIFVGCQLEVPSSTDMVMNMSRGRCRSNTGWRATYRLGATRRGGRANAGNDLRARIFNKAR